MPHRRAGCKYRCHFNPLRFKSETARPCGNYSKIETGMKKNISRSGLELVRSKLGSKSIVMIGLMGAGKTTVGRRLAQRLELPFVDADHEIERAAGMSVSDIFAQHGESYFRDGERKVIARLLSNGPQVLATGGGAFMDAETRENIADTGLSLWLKCSHKLLMKRVRKRGGRPLLDADNPDAVMQELMDKRYPVYGLADLSIVSRDVSHSTIVNDAIRALHAHFDTDLEQQNQ